MKKLSFDAQALLVLGVLGIGHLLDSFLKTDVFRDLAWVLCGILFLVNPVYPALGRAVEETRARGEARIAGVLLLLIGLMSLL